MNHAQFKDLVKWINKNTLSFDKEKLAYTLEKLVGILNNGSEIKRLRSNTKEIITAIDKLKSKIFKASSS